MQLEMRNPNLAGMNPYYSLHPIPCHDNTKELGSHSKTALRIPVAVSRMAWDGIIAKHLRTYEGTAWAFDNNGNFIIRRQ